MSVLGSSAGQELASAWPNPHRLEAALRARRAGDRHSRRVALLKRGLPVVGGILLALVIAWPRLGPFLESARLGLPLIDLREAHELRMLNPRYAGTDRLNRPYVVTSEIGRQVPNRDDLMSLERPRAEMTMHAGALVVMTAATAVYQPQAQLLDLFGEVTLVHQNGTRFLTKSAHVDVAANTAEGHDPVSGHGPSGDIAAQGFEILDKGDRVIFTGEANLTIKGTRPRAAAASPPALPPEVEAAAAQIEAAVMAPAVDLTPPAPPPSDLQTGRSPTDALPPHGTANRPAKLRVRAAANRRPGKA